MPRPLKNHPKRECNICGDMYKPYRHDTPTCGKPECRYEYRKSYERDYNREYYLMNIKDKRGGADKAPVRRETLVLECQIEEAERRKREERERKDREREARLKDKFNHPLPFGSDCVMD